VYRRQSGRDGGRGERNKWCQMSVGGEKKIRGGDGGERVSSAFGRGGLALGHSPAPVSSPENLPKKVWGEARVERRAILWVTSPSSRRPISRSWEG